MDNTDLLAESRAKFKDALDALRCVGGVPPEQRSEFYLTARAHEMLLTEALVRQVEQTKKWVKETNRLEERIALDATTIKAWAKESERLRNRKVELEMWWASLESPAPQYPALAAAWATWADSVWGDRTGQPQGALNHLQEEVQELIGSPFDAAEYADCFALLVDAARMAGIPPDKLLLAVEAKLEINKKRTWGPVGADGVSHHVKPEDPWRCGKCDGANVPEHFRTCPKRDKEPEARP